MLDAMDAKTGRQDTVFELEARTYWALGRLAELVNQGRAAGWIAGDVITDVTASDSFRLPGGDTPMRWLADRLRLSTVELDALWLLVVVELDPRVARAAQIVMSPAMTELDAQVLERLVMRGGVFEDDTLERLSRLGLIETSFDHRIPMYRRPVRARDRVVDLARGRIALDRELASIAVLANALDARRETMGLEVSTAFAQIAANEEQSLIVAKGPAGSGRSTSLRHAISSTGHGVLTVRGRCFATETSALVRQLHAIVRECRLHDAYPLLLELDECSDRMEVIDRELLRELRGPVFATAREAGAWAISRPTVTREMPRPDADARTRMWRQALPTASEALMGECAQRYALSPGLLGSTAAAVRATPAPEGITATSIHAALRSQLEKKLEGLAHRIETTQTWDDLVLPIDQFDMLIELVARVRHQRQVLETWGFAEKVGRGLGLSALMSGPPGTGKTMIAGLLARELGLDLYQVDLSRIVSKYIGETEKQLAALFDAAEAGHAILLFDEADSLFAKRTEVKSSNDRYANLEVNYLLQRMESFSGISILTTNHETSIDPAFMRRLAFHIRVPMPDDKHRSLIWRTIIPERAECEAELDFDALAAEFVMSGGYIKNAAVRAAFLAAAEGKAISSNHLWRAARNEYESMGKLAYQRMSAI